MVLDAAKVIQTAAEVLESDPEADERVAKMMARRHEVARYEPILEPMPAVPAPTEEDPAVWGRYLDEALLVHSCRRKQQDDAFMEHYDRILKLKVRPCST